MCQTLSALPRGPIKDTYIHYLSGLYSNDLSILNNNVTGRVGHNSQIEILMITSHNFRRYNASPMNKHSHRFPWRRIEREQITIETMLVIYCADHHGSRDRLCGECNQLLDYARRRLETCPFQESKPACNHCQVHCYATGKRQQVKAVMRYAGPRMIFRHPYLSLMHFLDKFRKAPSLSDQKG